MGFNSKFEKGEPEPEPDDYDYDYGWDLDQSFGELESNSLGNGGMPDFGAEKGMRNLFDSLAPKPRREQDPKRKVGKNDLYGRRLVNPQEPGDVDLNALRKKLKGEEG